MAMFNDYEARINYFKRKSNYHFDPLLNEEKPFAIPGRFSGDWSREIKFLERQSRPHSFNDIVEAAKKKGQINFQFDVSLNNDPSYPKSHVGFHVTPDGAINEAETPMLYKMVQWFAFEPGSTMAKLHIQYPGQSFPFHLDGLNPNRTKSSTTTAMKENPELWARIQVQLNDWIWGHIWAIGNHYWHQWRAGEIMYHSWWNIPHGTANCGFSPRFSLQVSGAMTPLTRERLNYTGQIINLNDRENLE